MRLSKKKKRKKNHKNHQIYKVNFCPHVLISSTVANNCANCCTRKFHCEATKSSGSGSNSKQQISASTTAAVKSTVGTQEVWVQNSPVTRLGFLMDT